MIKMWNKEECKEGYTLSPFDYKRRTRERLSRKKESDPKTLTLQKKLLIQSITKVTDTLNDIKKEKI